MKIRVADYIAKFLAEHEATAKTVFLVSGGGNMHLIDGIGKHPDLTYVCNHHEQACAIAAEGYARVSNKIGIAIVTTGPGGTNAITGVMGAWVDSIPMLVISGQVKFVTTIASQPELPLRQLGDQEINIVDIVKPITKSAKMMTDKNTIRADLEEAVYLAKHGRPGPVWLDIPLDIQGAIVDEDTLEGFTSPVEPLQDFRIPELLECLQKAERPVIVAGNGVRLADAIPEFEEVTQALGIPVLTTISGVDLIATEHPLFCGRPGILGERSANFIMQNSDCIVILGTRMNLRIISYNWEYFGREATKIMVDVDPAELEKHTLEIDVKIVADLKPFLSSLQQTLTSGGFHKERADWLTYCQSMKTKYPVVPEEYRHRDAYVSSHVFAEKLGTLLDAQSVTVTGNGTAYTSTFQTFPIQRGQRLFANVACASMGYDLPAAIGACFAHGKRDVVCLTGDGSIQMNLQELQTIIHYRLPVKLFMYNNNGYLSIRITQKNFFNGHIVGEGPESGVTVPDMQALANVYGFKTYRIGNHAEMDALLPEVLRTEGPVFCEVMLDPDEALYPKVSSYKKPDGTIVSKPLEDLFPFLERDEFIENMIIPIVGDA